MPGIIIFIVVILFFIRSQTRKEELPIKNKAPQVVASVPKADSSANSNEPKVSAEKVVEVEMTHKPADVESQITSDDKPK